MKPMVEIKNLEKIFPNRKGTEIRAVDGISFSLGEGELFSLLGPNGAGKTTTISMLSGLLEPSSGEVFIRGISMGQRPLEAKQHIGVVPQEVALYPRLTAQQNLEFFGRMYGMGGRELSKRIDELLDFIEISDRRNDRIESFSGGMKRRVNIAVGLIHEPPVLYMDEPTVGVDPQSRRRILDTIEHLKTDLGISILYTTHLMEEAEELSDRVGIIDHGKIIAVGTLSELHKSVNEHDRVEFVVGEGDVPSDFVETIERHETVSSATVERNSGESATPGHTILILSSDGRRLLPTIIQDANQRGLHVLSVQVREPNLESVFLAHTGRALRE